MKTRTVLTLLLVSIAVTSHPLRAQIQPDVTAVRDLLTARSLNCSFPWYVELNWEGDQPKISTANQEFRFQLDGIDYQQGTARIIGSVGAGDLVATSGTSSVSFMERVVSKVTLTTVYAWRDRAGRFKAVHSRHTAFGGPSPSQNYGHCLIW